MASKEIKKYFSDLAKKSHKKSPRPKSFYIKMAKIRWNKKVDKVVD